MKPERTLIIIKPEALQRNLLGVLLQRFEQKGLKIVGMKMMRLTDTILEEHYAHHKEKPFFSDLKRHMQHSPVVALVLEGEGAVQGVRLITGATKGIEADAGTIRGDFAMGNKNLVHASDSPENAAKEVARFFTDNELFDYLKLDEVMVYDR